MLPASWTLGIHRLRQGEPQRLGAAVAAGAVVLVLLGAAAIAYGPHPFLPIAVLLAMAAAPWVLGSVDAAFVALVAVIMLLPFGAIRLGIGFNPTLLDPALGVLYLILVMRLVTRRQSGLRWPPLAAFVLIFMGFMLAALLAGMTHGVPAKNQLRVFAELLMGAGMYIVVANLITDRRGLRRAFLALVVLGAAAAGIGLALYVMPDALQIRLLSALGALDYPTGPGVLRFLNDDPTRLQRATGTAVDPNSFGGMLAVVTALLLPQLMARRPWLPRRVGLGLAAVLGLALLATVSRGSLVGLAAGAVVIGLLRDRRVLLTGLVVGLGVLVLARVMPWSAAYVDHLLAGFAGGYDADRATQMRMGEYRDALRLIGRYPWFGVGFGDPKDIDLYRGVSSLYLILAETIGGVGLAAFVAALGACMARLAWTWRALGNAAEADGPSSDGLRAMLLGCLAGLAAAAVSGIFDHYFFTYPHAFALLWLVMGLGMCGVGLAEAETRRPGPAVRAA